jgi:hypothetical protein
LDLFVTEEFLEEDMDMKHVDPENEVFTIRSQFHRPLLRLFGWFLAPRCFIGTHVRVRDDLADEQWAKAISKTIVVRAQLFPGVVLYRGESFEDYI